MNKILNEQTLNKQIKIASFWSGGKDSCLACFKAIRAGYKIGYLFNLISNKDHCQVSFHSIPKDLVRLQIEATKLKLFQREISPAEIDSIKFEKDLRNLLRVLLKKDIKGLVFGYTAPDDKQRFLAKRVCSELGLKLIEPLCGKNPKETLKEFIELGFKAVIVRIDSKILDKYWLGRPIDKDFFEYLEKRVKSGNSIDFCGDLGEFHTFVIDGPLFKREIKLIETEKVKKDDYWILDIIKADYE